MSRSKLAYLAESELEGGPFALLHSDSELRLVLKTSVRCNLRAGSSPAADECLSLFFVPRVPAYLYLYVWPATCLLAHGCAGT